MTLSPKASPPDALDGDQPAKAAAPPEQPISRFRLTFGKSDALRWTGHLDLRQSWERTFRRARLPLAYSRGYHPHPKLLFGSPLPLGFIGDAELMDASLDGEHEVEQIEAPLGAACPPGLELRALRRLPRGGASITTLVTASRYEMAIDLGRHPELAQEIARLLAAPELPRARRSKTYDLRPLVEQLELDEQASRLAMQLACREGQTGRPEEVLCELGLHPHELVIQRRRLLLREVVEQSDSD